MLTRLTLVAVAAFMLVAASAPAQASQLNNDQVAIRAAYVSFVDAQNAHNIPSIQKLLWDNPKLVWLTVTGPIWGPAAVINRFKQLFAGVWSSTVDYSNTDIVVHDATQADVIAPVSVTATTISGGTPITGKAIVVTMFQKVGKTWMVAGIVPVAASVKNY
jgi:ketosteroid isomerase-like protein